ncbi:multidrug and toxin extrusion protein 1-like [Antedon mediterranea]|uniref:multidrug and toxin extrusion protein 1-like n=1 Tax=Antedon mediterranea TaxID=105859 RepID=UPI003AF7937C
MYRYSYVIAEWMKIQAKVVYAVFITIGLSRILQCRDKIGVTAIAAIVSVCFNILLNYILVYVLDMGFRGSAIAVVVAQYINCILLAVYVYKYEDLEFFSLKSLENWGEFFSIAVHGGLTYEIMQVCIMVCYILSERFGAIDVAVFGAFNILAAYVLIMLIGFCVSLTIMVGQYLGQNDSKKAKIIVEIAFIFISIFLFWLFNCFSDCDQAIIKAILQAIGRQNVGSLTSLISYSIGLVLAAVFAFKLHWKTTGLWAGIVMADGIEAFILIIVLNNIDFARESELALERCRVSEDQQLYTEIEDDDVSKETLLKIESNDEKIENEDIKETRSLIENTEYKLIR